MDRVDAPLIIAIQSELAEESDAFRDLSASMRIIEIDRLKHPDDAIRSILARRLELDDEVDAKLDDVFRDDAFAPIAAFYDGTGRSFREMLAMVQTAVESAMDMNAEHVTAAHVLEASNDWRRR